MNVSIVIPVYNEADHLAACLEAIARQSIEPFEVIVVDNNSTDGTAGLAAGYDFVTLLYEKRQGVVHARSLGFDFASGDIIARIDGDTRLPVNWVERVQKIMSDPGISAVSGAPDYHDFALPKVANAVDHYFRRNLAGNLGNRNFLYGANMAMRRSAWLKVRPYLCNSGGMHEDFDLGIHLQELDYKVVYNASLIAGVSSRRIDTGLLSYIRYTLVSPRTYALHRLKTRRHMYPVILVCWLCYLPGHLINKTYDHKTRSFSLSRLLLPSRGRVDPTANVV